jgi:fermentation-respiration switch protein FrsA (DUF1100 family)
MGCGGLFFYPQKELRDNPVAQQFSPEDVFFKTPDNLTLHGWFFRTARPEPRGTVFVLHGNAENLSTHVNSVLWLVKEGFDLFIFDYRGYGRSEGSPGIKGVHVDAEAALETLLAMQRVKDGKIVVLGQSIGGAIAVYTAANSSHKDRIASLVIESAFSSYRLIAREKLGQFFLTWPLQYPLSFLFTDAYSPVRWIKQVSPIPILILHGEQDPIVPLHHGQLLYDAAAQPKEFWRTTAPGHVYSFADKGVRDNLVRHLSAELEKKDQSLPK